MIKLTNKLVMVAELPRSSPLRVLSGVTDGIYPVRNRVFTNAIVNGEVNGEPRVLSLSQEFGFRRLGLLVDEFWSTIRDIMERDRLIESQQVAARRFKLNKMRYRHGR
jgi:hypothetical protein